MHLLGPAVYHLLGENIGLTIGVLTILLVIGGLVNAKNPLKGIESFLGGIVLIVIIGLAIIFTFKL